MIHFYISCEILAWGRFIVLFMDHAVTLAPSVNLLGESHLAISLMDADGSKEWEIDAARNPAKNKLNCPIKIYKMNWLGWPTSDRKVVNFPSHENRVGRGKRSGIYSLIWVLTCNNTGRHYWNITPTITTRIYEFVRYWSVEMLPPRNDLLIRKSMHRIISCESSFPFLLNRLFYIFRNTKSLPCNFSNFFQPTVVHSIGMSVQFKCQNCVFW